ncbi:hypothetical protein ACFVYF_15765 [Streptomyces sp. NPDC058274]|uniref:hypothetical protein n=1 Tax=Streptomyces sp. NPDC058274 TaxID=3346416 RepID=UPI0036E7004B
MAPLCIADGNTDTGVRVRERRSELVARAHPGSGDAKFRGPDRTSAPKLAPKPVPESVVDATRRHHGRPFRHRCASTAPEPRTSTTATATATARARVTARTRTRALTRIRIRIGTTGPAPDGSPHVDRTPAHIRSAPRIFRFPVHPWRPVPQLAPFFDAFGEQRLRASAQDLSRSLAAASGAAAEAVMTMAGTPVGDGSAARAARRGGCA